MKVTARGHGRLVLLFLLAVVLPSLALVLLTLRMIGQERELAEKRLVDDRGRLAAEIGRFLLLRLENIKLQQTGGVAPLNGPREYKNPEVVLVGRVVEDRLALPWEDRAGAEAFSRSLRQPGFSQIIRSGEMEEFKSRNPKRATEYYSRALSLAHSPIQQSYARLLLARTLLKAGRADCAAEQYQAVMSSPSGAVDDYGIHLSLYACRGLVELGASGAEVVHAVTALLRQDYWHSPAEAYLLKDLVEKLGRDAAGAASEEIGECLGLVEQGLALQRDFSALRIILSGTIRPVTRSLYGPCTEALPGSSALAGKVRNRGLSSLRSTQPGLWHLSVRS